jgi:hypothetical protein
MAGYVISTCDYAGREAGWGPHFPASLVLPPDVVIIGVSVLILVF